MLSDGYRYYFTKRNKSGTILWRCENRVSCSATITLNSFRTNILRKTNHTCASNSHRNEVFKLIDKCKKDVCENLEPVQQIFENNVHNMRETIGSQEDEEYRNWVPSFSSLKSALYRERKKFLDVKKLVFKSLEEVVIPKTLKK